MKSVKVGTAPYPELMRGWYDFTVNPPLHKAPAYEMFDPDNDFSDNYYVATTSTTGFSSSNSCIYGDPQDAKFNEILVTYEDLSSSTVFTTHLYHEGVGEKKIASLLVQETNLAIRHGTSQRSTDNTNYYLFGQTEMRYLGEYVKTMGPIRASRDSSGSILGWWVVISQVSIMDPYHFYFDIVCVYLYWGSEQSTHDRAYLWQQSGSIASEPCGCYDTHVLIPP